MIIFKYCRKLNLAIVMTFPPFFWGSTDKKECIFQQSSQAGTQFNLQLQGTYLGQRPPGIFYVPSPSWKWICKTFSPWCWSSSSFSSSLSFLSSYFSSSSWKWICKKLFNLVWTGWKGSSQNAPPPIVRRGQLNLEFTMCWKLGVPTSLWGERVLIASECKHRKFTPISLLFLLLRKVVTSQLNCNLLSALWMLSECDVIQYVGNE